MLREKHNTAIDAKWRLSLPANVGRKFGKRSRSVFVSSTSEGCVSFYPCGRNKSSRPEGCERIPLRRIREKYLRVTIPESLRDSTSFHYGSTVTVAVMKDHIELWPLPPEERKSH